MTWGKLAAFGVLIGVGQFGLLFWAMRSDISPGLASLVIQSQVFFTIGLSAVMYRDRLKALAVARVRAGGRRAGDRRVACVDAGRRHRVRRGAGDRRGDGLGRVQPDRARGRPRRCARASWSGRAPFAAVPLWVISLLQNGPQPIGDSLAHAGLVAWLAVAWQAIGNTLFGYGVWNWLLARHSASTVTPTALLVPVFGMTASALALHEGLPMWKLGAAALVMGGLAVNLLATRRKA